MNKNTSDFAKKFASLFKKLKALAQKLTPLKIVALSGVFIIALFLLASLTVFLIEAFYTSTGQMEQMILTADDFELYAIEKEDESYVSINEDSRITLNKDIIVKNVSMEISYAIDPGEVTLYYADTGQEAFSETKRIWFTLDENGNYTAEFNLAKRVDSLRLDPTIYGGNIMEIGEITINTPKSFVQYFSITPSHVYYFVMLTTMLSCLAGFALDILKNNKQ